MSSGALCHPGVLCHPGAVDSQLRSRGFSHLMTLTGGRNSLFSNAGLGGTPPVHQLDLVVHAELVFTRTFLLLNGQIVIGGPDSHWLPSRRQGCNGFWIFELDALQVSKGGCAAGEAATEGMPHGRAGSSSPGRLRRDTAETCQRKVWGQPLKAGVTTHLRNLHCKDFSVARR